jgi:hypothetical protein
LLEDRRYPTVRRHLRRLYVDPITGQQEWGLVKAPEGGIMGIYSLSDREPQKHANFEAEDADFASVLPFTYSNWKFVYRPDGIR